MSEIIVKQLAQIVGTPIEVMLQQLQDAGIPVSSPDDAITDTQKLQLLEHIRKGQQSDTTVPGKAKLSIKRRTVSERKITGTQGNKSTVTVEVRRKKRAAAKPVQPNSTATSTGEAETQAVSKSQEFTAKLEAERKALEEVRHTDAQSEEEVATNEPEVKVKAETDASAVEETAATEAKLEAVKPPAEEVKPLTEEVVPQETVVTKAAEEEAAPAPTAPAPTVNKVKAKETPEKPAPSSTSTLSRSASSINFFEAARRHKEASGANSARDEAASLLKKRPSRKPKVTIKPTKASPTTAATPASTTDSAATRKKKKTFQGRGNQLHMSNQGAGGRRRKKGRSRKSAIKIERSGKHGFEMPTAPVVKEIEIPDTIILSELAKSLSIQSTDIIKQLMGMGVMATINQTLDQDTAILVTEELGHKAVPVASQEDDEVLLAAVTDDYSEYKESPRPPVVTIMGHVDHGKTSLLDYIRDSRVTAGEAGGITQHIGAYHVDTPNGAITFLDTPGHAAFSSMRSRGAQATDIVVVVVAADDSVMPQTREAIEHTRAAGAPLIIAINKMDKENADPERVKSDLSAMEVIPEDWGGDDVFVEVSAITGKGVDNLLEAITLVAEIQELKARVDGPATGLVVEASIEKGRGAVATVLVQNGTLKAGDMVLCGQEYGRVRAMLDDQGKSTKSVTPSTPVSILGLSGAPRAGDEMIAVANERKAREIAEVRRHRERETRLSAQQAAKLEALFANMNSGGEVSQLNILIKADVQGSVEALRHTLLDLSTDEVKVNIVSSGVGGINESDASLANAASAVIIAFNVRADATARRIASESAIDIRYYSIIYEAIDDIKAAMSGMLSPELREEFVGLAEVKDVFHSSSLGAVAGCLVVDGTIKQGLPIRILRDNVVVYEGELESLRRHKDNVKDVHTGTECGIGVKNYNDIKAGDQIECFRRTEVARFIE